MNKKGEEETVTQDSTQQQEEKKRYATAHVYFGDHVDLLLRMNKLCLDHPGVSRSNLLILSLSACISSIEKALSSGKRKFKLNGIDVEY